MDIEEQKATLLTIMEEARKEMELLEIYYKMFETLLATVQVPIWELEKNIRIKFSALRRFEEILKGTYAPHLTNYSHDRKRNTTTEESVDL